MGSKTSTEHQRKGFTLTNTNSSSVLNYTQHRTTAAKGGNCCKGTAAKGPEVEEQLHVWRTGFINGI